MFYESLDSPQDKIRLIERHRKVFVEMGPITVTYPDLAGKPLKTN